MNKKENKYPIKVTEEEAAIQLQCAAEESAIKELQENLILKLADVEKKRIKWWGDILAKYDLEAEIQYTFKTKEKMLVPSGLDYRGKVWHDQDDTTISD